MDIEELFIIIIDSLISGENDIWVENEQYFNTDIKDIPSIMNFSTISKNHNQWFKKTNFFNCVCEMQICYEWLSAQYLNKAKKNHISIQYINEWASTRIKKFRIDEAVKFFNHIHKRKFDHILGSFLEYNIKCPYINPDLRRLTNVYILKDKCRLCYVNNKKDNTFCNQCILTILENSNQKKHDLNSMYYYNKNIDFLYRPNN